MSDILCSGPKPELINSWWAPALELSLSLWWQIPDTQLTEWTLKEAFFTRFKNHYSAHCLCFFSELFRSYNHFPLILLFSVSFLHSLDFDTCIAHFAHPANNAFVCLFFLLVVSLAHHVENMENKTLEGFVSFSGRGNWLQLAENILKCFSAPSSDANSLMIPKNACNLPQLNLSILYTYAVQIFNQWRSDWASDIVY